MKILVVYATKTGITEDIARRIGNALRSVGGDVRVIPVASAPSPAGFDAVIVGSGVRAGRWHKAATAWFNRHADSIRKMPSALFTVCMTMATAPEKAPEVLAYTTPMIQAAQISPVGVGLFAGWFVPGKFGFVERFILKKMKTPEGDFRDYEAVDAWALEIAPRLGLAIDMKADSSLQVDL